MTGDGGIRHQTLPQGGKSLSKVIIPESEDLPEHIDLPVESHYS